MRKIYVLIIITLFIISVNSIYAQEKIYTLYGGSTTYIARDWIEMREGLYSPDFEAIIDESLPFDVDYLQSQPNPNRELDKTLPVGSTSGTFNVSSTGAAIYSIPIEVPPGTAGIQPNLAITYNSQGGNGLLGIGWDLAGLSAIIRVGKTIYHDNTTGGVNLDANDKFALDGNRVINLNYPYGGNNVEYRTEIESFSVIKSYDTNGDNQPEYFKVWTKDGKLLEYGVSDDSKIIKDNKAIFWYLNKISDVHGNYMTYHYFNTNGEFYITEIKYTWNNPNNPYNKVRFYYEERTADPVTNYIAGSAIKQNALLYKIKTFTEDIVVKEYQLIYWHDNENLDPFSHLSEIIEKGSDGSELNSTIFNWGNTTTKYENVPITNDWTLEDPYGQKFFQGDFNGDGQTDIFRALTFYDGTKSYFSSWELYLASNNGYSFDYQTSGTLDDLDIGFYIGDFNGDGKHDLLKCAYDGFYWQYRAFISTGNNFEILSDRPSLTSITLDYEHEIFIGELDGDGFTDVFVKRNIKVGSEDDWEIYSYSQNVNGDIFPMHFRYSGTISSWGDRVYDRDFNGDGKTDLVVLDTDGRCKVYEFDGSSLVEIFNSGYPTMWHNTYWGDFNGDNKIDVITWHSTADWELHYNLGTDDSWSWPGQPVTLPDYDHESDDNNYNIHIRDFNGDGKDDILDVYKQSGTVYLKMLYSNGSTFYEESMTLLDVDAFLCKIHRFVDFNGDGKEDIFYYRDKWTPSRIFTFHPNERKHLLNIITDGLNAKKEIDYKPLTNDIDNFYTKDSESSFPVLDFQGALYTVSSYSYSNGLNETNSLSYKYKGLKIHKQGKGFLGFSEISSKDIETGIKTTSTYYQEFYCGTRRYFLSLPKITKSENTKCSTFVSESENTYVISELDQNKKRIFPWLQKNISKDLITGTKTETTNVYNTDGNLTSSLVKYYNNDNSLLADLTTTYSNYEDRITVPSDLNPYPNKPGTITTSKTHSDDPYITYTRRTDYTYKNTGKVETIVTDPLLTKKTTTVNEYYSNGNLKKTTLIATDLTNRFTSYEYDTRGRFITKVTDALGNFTEKAYDERTGNIVLEKDIYGNLTSYYYDGFGRLNETHLPTGKRIEQSINWYTGSELTYALYYTVTSPEGSSPVSTYYDLLGRELRTVTKNIDGTDIIVDKEYNGLGLMERVSTPYFAGSQSLAKWTEYEYDDPIYRLTEETFNDIRILEYEYTGRATKKTNTSVTPNQWSKKTIDVLGNLEKAEDNGGIINYKYDASCQVKEIQAPGSTVIITYDDYGRQQTLTDPDAGTITYDYNAFGELHSQTDNSGNTFTMVYDQLGRIDYKTGPEGTTEYEYYTSGFGNELLKKVTGPNGIYDSYEYDGFGRTISKTSYIETGKSFTTQTKYDDFGRVYEITYPTDFTISYLYNIYGYMDEVKRKDNGNTIWKAGTMDQYGQWKDYTLGDNLLKTEKTYDDYGMLHTIKTKKISDGIYKQNLEYSFDIITGNLTWRRDHMHTVNGTSLNETFTFDGLNRVTSFNNANGTIEMDYDNAKDGNLAFKSDIGYMSYTGPRPHAVTQVDNDNGLIPTTEQTITYTPFNKVSAISELGAYAGMTIVYGASQTRKKTTISKIYTSTKTRYYSGLYEKEITGSDTRDYCYIQGGDGLAAVYISQNGGAGSLYYIESDYLGSINMLIDNTGAIAQFNGQAQEYSFDPWGRRRNPANWSYDNVPTDFLVFRGFTGHEHIDVFNLINMNGRVYDPILGRFLSPDNFVQLPDFTQNFNRYAYCLNNPLIYTDPDGEFIFTVLAAIFAPPLLPLAIAADIGGTMNLAMNANNIDNFGQGLAYYGIGAAAGAIGAGVGMGVNAAIAGGSFWAGVAGTSTVVSTGFASGFVSGAAGGFAGGFASGFGNAAMEPVNDLGDMFKSGWDYGWKGAVIGGVAGGIMGGIDAVSHDRNFWTGSGKQGVVIQVNTQGNGELIGEQDYNAPYTTQQTKDNYRTQLSDNSSVTTASDGQLAIKIPNDVNRITGIAAPENTYFKNFNIGRNVITLTPLDKTSYVILHGWRYYSNPVTTYRDLFYWRPRFY